MGYALPFAAGNKVVELGGGDRPQFRPNVDIRKCDGVDLVADLNQPLPTPGDQFDGVFSMYAIEHVSWRNVRTLIAEAFRLLKPGGRAVFIAPNLREQARVLAEKEVWEDTDVCMLFGDQNYGENAHACGFSPESATRMFREAGFEAVLVLPHPNCGTDMIIEAKKADPPKVEIHPERWTPEERRLAYGRDYFDGGKGPVGGYAREGYWDYPVHWATFGHVMARKPESVLEIGAARGYVLKRLEDAGVRVAGLEVSEHCQHTRVVQDIARWDVTQTPWPVGDGAFDLAFSVATFEHIPEQHLDAVFRELTRVSKRGLHGIDFGEHDDGFDKTHCTLRPREWWVARMPKGHEVVDKEELEKGDVKPPAADGKVKLNVGSFTTMFHAGWVNLDVHPLQGWAQARGFVYRQCDVRKGLPFDDGVVDLAYACHFLEHLNYDEGAAFLAECVRVMKPGAVLRLLFPDAGMLTAKMQRGELGDYDEVNEGCAKVPSQAGKLWALLFAGHSAMYDWDGVETALRGAGFQTVLRKQFRESESPQMLRETVDMFPTLSLYVEAVR